MIKIFDTKCSFGSIFGLQTTESTNGTADKKVNVTQKSLSQLAYRAKLKAGLITNDSNQEPFVFFGDEWSL